MFLKNVVLHEISKTELNVSSRYVFSWYPFYFDFQSARIIFDVSSGFYLWNINNTKADIQNKMDTTKTHIVTIHLILFL
jgi:hypothetical protein